RSSDLFAFDALYAAELRKSPKITCKERSIEMQRIGNLVEGCIRRVDGPHELALCGGHGLYRIFFERRRPAVEKHLQPVGGKRHRAEPGSGRAEGMKVETAGTRPLPVSNSEFERRSDLA